MRVAAGEIEGLIVIEPVVHRDDRGFFVETYHRRRYREAGVDPELVQDNQSASVRNTVRGLHAQATRPQGKLVRAIEGEILDVAVDIRPGSATFGRAMAIRLSDQNFRQLWIPPGFAHGFCVLSESAQVAYKCTGYYDPEDEIVIRWNDPRLGIEWPVKDPLLSDRDRQAPLLAEVEHLLA